MLYDVVEVVAGENGAGERTDTVTGSKRYALDRKADLLHQNRAAFIRDQHGNRL